jgi:hypothetical protein
MSDCCAKNNSPRQANKLACPRCGSLSLAVSEKTLLHHLKQPWRWSGGQGYFGCETQDCELVYFSAEGAVITADALRTTPGLKSSQADAAICYGFGLSRADAAMPEARAFVLEQTRLGNCSCEARHPYGRCCLKDFPKPA